MQRSMCRGAAMDPRAPVFHRAVIAAEEPRPRAIGQDAHALNGMTVGTGSLRRWRRVEDHSTSRPTALRVRPAATLIDRRLHNMRRPATLAEHAGSIDAVGGAIDVAEIGHVDLAFCSHRLLPQ